MEIHLGQDKNRKIEMTCSLEQWGRDFLVEAISVRLVSGSEKNKG